VIAQRITAGKAQPGQAEVEFGLPHGHALPCRRLESLLSTYLKLRIIIMR
jgi:predicted RNA polymerase sigma factor